MTRDRLPGNAGALGGGATSFGRGDAGGYFSSAFHASSFHDGHHHHHHHGHHFHHHHHHHSFLKFCFGFGFFYHPFFWPYCPYPFVRYYAYYPYPYYATYIDYPVYVSVYHRDYVPVSYVEYADPYVEYTVEVRPRPLVPEPFRTPLTTDLPEGLGTEDLLARGIDWMHAGNYLPAAEAFRRVWVARPEDSVPPLQLATALFGAGRYDLAGHALAHGLDRDPDAFKHRVGLRESFPSAAAFGEALDRLQRYLVENPKQGEARFLLGYVALSSGDPFTAHAELTRLRDAGWESPHLGPLIDEAKARVLAEPPK